MAVFNKSKKKILIIEDDTITGRNLKSFLTDAGFQVDLEIEGDKGLERALGNPYDMLLLDIWLPKLNGFEILQSLVEKKSAIPIIVLSNSGQPVEIEKALKMGVKDYLVKANFTPQEVLEKVKKYFQGL